MKSLSRLLAITKKEVRQMRRDRLTFGMIVGIPVMQMLLFGYAINSDVRDLRTAVADQANTHLSRQFIAELRETQVVDISNQFVQLCSDIFFSSGIRLMNTSDTLSSKNTLIFPL